MREALWFIFKAAIGGVISFITPRALVALGVPLDDWIVAAVDWLTLKIDSESALWLASLVIFIAIFASVLFLDHRKTVLTGNIALGVPQDVLDTVNNKHSMPLIELREILRATSGWNPDVGLEYKDLQKAFREAAHHQVLLVRGRKDTGFREDQILVDIPSTYWLVGTLDLMKFAHAERNEEICTRTIDLSNRDREPIYFDLELNRPEALNWIKESAAKYRGQADHERKKNLSLKI